MSDDDLPPGIVRVYRDAIQQTIIVLYERAGIPREAAKIVATSIVDAALVEKTETDGTPPE